MDTHWPAVVSDPYFIIKNLEWMIFGTQISLRFSLSILLVIYGEKSQQLSEKPYSAMNHIIKILDFHTARHLLLFLIWNFYIFSCFHVWLNLAQIYLVTLPLNADWLFFTWGRLLFSNLFWRMSFSDVVFLDGIINKH